MMGRRRQQGKLARAGARRRRRLSLTARNRISSVPQVRTNRGDDSLSQVVVNVPPALRKFASGKARVSVEAVTVRQALTAFAEGSTALYGYIFDQNERLRPFVRVFIDGEPASARPDREEPIGDGTEMTILLALAGG
jgi:hypothetical protein